MATTTAAPAPFTFIVTDHNRVRFTVRALTYLEAAEKAARRIARTTSQRLVARRVTGDAGLSGVFQGYTVMSDGGLNSRGRSFHVVECCMLEWIDYPGGSRRDDGAKVGEFFSGPGEAAEWWAYPPGWRPRGEVEALGPFMTRQEAKDGMTSWLGLTI